MSQAAPEITDIVGLDLGQQADPSALAVLERTEHPNGRAIYACRHLQRWHLGTPYPQMVDETVALLSRRELRDVTLVVDQTGVGRAVVDLFRLQVHCPFRPVTITSGANVSRLEDGEIHIPKKDLVATLQVLLGGRRLQIAASLPEAKLLVKELQNFQVKITAAANEIFGAWRSGQHDDLVLAVAMAAWIGEHACSGKLSPSTHPAARSMMSQVPRGVFWSDDASEEEDDKRSGSAYPVW